VVWGHRAVTITDQPAAQRGANLLLGYAIGAAVLWLVNVLVSRVLPVSAFESLDAAMQLGWLGLAVVFAVGVVFIGTASDRPGLAWALVGLITVGALFDLAFTLLRLFLKDDLTFWSLLSYPSMVVGLAERVVFLVFAVRLCGPSRPWALLVALVAGGVGVLRLAAGVALSLRLFDYGAVGDWYPLFLGVMGLVSMGGTLALIIGARSAIVQTATGLAPAVGVARVSHEPVSPAADLGIGAVLLVVGLAISVGSYALASSSGGGRYLVATGFIGVGVGRLIRGMMRAAKQSP